MADTLVFGAGWIGTQITPRLQGAVLVPADIADETAVAAALVEGGDQSKATVQRAHEAVLCPSFYKTEIVINPGFMDRLAWRFRQGFIGWLQRRGEKRRLRLA